ncbi:hypothetical protein [Kitasatospora cinereorecta]|uniref:Uncharacterized protein n=1 Tax=Kitasatospora cinereorecta TaxID=285560 RepID=A0ABW0VA55_9ACTN
MNDLPQGGAGGVPLDHDEPDPRHPRHGEADHTGAHAPDRPHTVRTVRGGTAVGEQQAEPADDTRDDEHPGR